MTKKKAAKKTERRQRTAPPPSAAESSMQANRKRDRKAKEGRSRSPTRKIRKNSGNSNGSTSPFSLTPNAIESIISGVDMLSRSTSKAKEASAEKNPKTKLILRLRFDARDITESTEKGKQTNGNPNDEDPAALFVTLGDGKSSIRAMILNPHGIWSNQLKPEEKPSGGEERTRDWIVEVRGYATTEKFWHKTYRIFPIVCLTAFGLLKIEETKPFLGKPLLSNSASGKSGLSNTNFKAQAGTIGTFLKERSPFLTNEELAGLSRIVDEKVDASANPNDEETTNDGSPVSRDQNFKKVQECLSQHSAMLTLQQSSLSPASSSRKSEVDNPSSPSSTTARADNDSSSPQPPASPLKSSRPGQHAWELYDGALREFRISQMDRQKASLGTNAGRESAERAQMVVDRHNSALELALREEGPLSIELLEKWHKELLNGLHPEAGLIRTKKVRCGHTIFCPPKRIRNELELYFAGLKSLERRLHMENNALHVVLFAAVAMFGIVDIHPFIDGNGRLSRIVANYALKRLPFPINLFATAAQRNEYVVAIERTRHFLSFNCAYGDVVEDDLVQVLKTTGVFGSLVQLLMDRVARAATALTASWEEKSCLAAEAAEAKAARRVRERASRGTCMICLDEKPNIATLCCGNAIHLNCCAEWLSGNNKCPICRHEMPSISRRVVRAMEEPEDRWEGDDENDHSDLVEPRRHAVLSREYENFVDRFWDEIRNSRDRGNRIVRPPPNLLLHLDRFQPNGDEIEDEFHTTTTTSEDEDVGEPLQPQNPNVNGHNRAQPNNEFSEEHNVGIDDTTTTFEGDFGGSDASYQTTTPMDGSDENNDTTTTDYSDASSQEPRQRGPTYACCAATRCRNRPAVDCINNLCGRCCILIGNYHCPRHNS